MIPNPYPYVQNDPVNSVDPSGLKRKLCGLFYVGDCDYEFVCCGELSPFDGFEPKAPPPPDPPGVFDDAYRDCLPKLGKEVAPGLVQASAIVQAADTSHVDRTLLAFTWFQEAGGFNFHPTNGLHDPDELIGDIGPGQVFPGIWGVSPFTDGLDDPFGSNREVGHQEFNGDPVENLVLAGRALNHPLGAVQGNRRREAAGLYKAGSQSGPGYQTRVDKWGNANVNAYDAFFGCLKDKGF